MPEALCAETAPVLDDDDELDDVVDDDALAVDADDEVVLLDPAAKAVDGASPIVSTTASNTLPTALNLDWN